MIYVGEFRANLVVYRFCEVLSYKKWTLISQYIFLEIIRQPSIISKIDRVVFTLITFCIIWKDTIFSVISILNFLKSTSRQIFTKTKRLKGSKTIVFDFNIIFVFINVWLPMLLKKFNMDITEKMVSFQIIQNALIVKRTLADVKWSTKHIVMMFWA